MDDLILLFPGGNTDFSSMGLGALSDAISCVVKEELNGEFELEMIYPITGIRYEQIALRSIIVAKPNPNTVPQPFRVYGMTKPIDGIVTINAAHISYDLSGYPVAPFTSASLRGALTSLTSGCAVSCPFSFQTTRNDSGSFAVAKPSSIRSVLGGGDASILSTFGGEYEFNGFTVKLHSRRGQNRGVSIRYGKNMTSLEQEENCSEVYTGIYPYWYSEKDGVVSLPEKVLNAAGTYAFTRVLPVDLTSEFQEKPTVAQLRSAGEQYLAQNEIGVPSVSITVSFVSLAMSEEYREYAILETVAIGDIVNVEFPALGVAASAECVGTTYDVITGKYTELSLGNARNSLAATISDQKKDISNAPTRITMEQAIDHATQTICGALGGHVLLHSSTGDKEPDEILIMDTDNIATASKVWRWNAGGLGYSSSGYNGSYGLAMTMDGSIVANYINTGELDCSSILVSHLTAEGVDISGKVQLGAGSTISWADIDESGSSAYRRAGNAYSLADDAYDEAEEAKQKAIAVANGTASGSFISGTSISSPTIYGGRLYASSGELGSFAEMNAQGFFIHRNSASVPKLSMHANDDGSVIRIEIGAGTLGNDLGKLILEKRITENGAQSEARIFYQRYDSMCHGFVFDKNGMRFLGGTPTMEFVPVFG